MHYSSHPKDNPCPAVCARTKSGVPWTAAMICGYDPFVYARIVKDLSIYWDDDGPILEWKTLKIPE